jgi:hypothetical protein
MGETKEGLMQLANDATLGQSRYETLDKTSQDLDDEIDNLIEKQKDTDNIKEDEEIKEIEEKREDEKEKIANVIVEDEESLKNP